MRFSVRILLILTSLTVHSQQIEIEPVPNPVKEMSNPGMPQAKEDTTISTIPDNIRAKSDSLIEASIRNVPVSPGAPVISLRHHVGSPHQTGVYQPRQPAPIDTTDFNWWYLLKHKRLKLDDPRVKWPRFIGWGIGVYNKVNKAVNSYDPAYIASTGKSGKVRLVSDNWTDQYIIQLDPVTRIAMLSRPFYSLGVNVAYLGIGYTYSLDLSNIIGNRTEKHTQHKFGFGTQMFQIDYKYYSSEGGSIIREFSKLPDDIKLNRHFPGMDIKTWSLTGYYFFNNKKYSQGAAYSFSKLQKKSAGTAIIGIGYTSSDLFFDFNRFPEDLLPFLDQETMKYRFHYRNLSLLAGYAYNFVIHKRLLLNVTAIPGVGYNRCYEDSQEKKFMGALSLHSGLSLAYNLDFLFCGFDTKWDMLTYHTSRYSLTSSILNFSISLGRRF